MAMRIYAYGAGSRRLFSRPGGRDTPSYGVSAPPGRRVVRMGTHGCAGPQPTQDIAPPRPTAGGRAGPGPASRAVDLLPSGGRAAGMGDGSTGGRPPWRTG